MLARVIGQNLAEALGKPVVIDNRGGAASVIGTEMVAKSAPDGYVLLFSTSSMIITPLLSQVSYDPVKDFAPISLLAVNPFLLVAHPSVPAASIKELIALATAQPGKLNYATSGTGGPNHFSMELFKSMTGVAIVHVPYKGAGPAITDLLAGQVQLMFNNIPPFLPHVKTGKLKPLGVSSARRSLAIPDIPTISEAGVPGFEYVSWYAVYAPAKTPKDIVTRLNAEFVKILSGRELVQRFASQGFEPQSSTPAGLTQFMREDTDRLKRVIQAASIKAE